MNLLTDGLFMVESEDGKTSVVSLREVLCGRGVYRSMMPMPDMEFAQIQLAVSLTQVVFQPKDEKELFLALRKPMSKKRFDQGVKEYGKYFELRDPVHPFMQVPQDTKKKKDPQTIYACFAKGNSPPLFTGAEEIQNICEPCTAKLMFFRPIHGPSFGGGMGKVNRGEHSKSGEHKQGNSFSLLISDGNLRTTIWHNILTVEQSRGIFGEKNEPCWFDRWTPDEVVNLSELGLFRGMFWEPCMISLEWEHRAVRCDLCGQESDWRLESVANPKVFCRPVGFFPHPHAVWLRATRAKTYRDKHASLTPFVPLWRDFMWYLTQPNLQRDSSVEVYLPPTFNNGTEDLVDDVAALSVIVGSYETNPKFTLCHGKKFESMSINAGFIGDRECLCEFVRLVADGESALGGALGCLKRDVNGRLDKNSTIGKKAVSAGKRLYYERMERFVSRALSASSDFHERRGEQVKKIASVMLGAFDDATEYLGYRCPRRVAEGRSRLLRAIGKMRKENSNDESDSGTGDQEGDAVLAPVEGVQEISAGHQDKD